MCSSGVGFDPVVGGVGYTFDVYGLYNGLFVMADRQTGSVWTHYDGQVLTGPLAESGAAMRIIPVVHITWSEWIERHPDSLVLDWYEEFAGRYRPVRPGAAGLGPQFQRTLLNWDTRLPENELVLGVNVGDQYRAYVLSELGDGISVVEDELGGRSIAVFSDSEANYALAFSTELGGKDLEFSVAGGEIMDTRGNAWDLTGKAVSGPDSGAQLEYVTSFVSEWYGWAAYHPQTGIYGR